MQLHPIIPFEPIGSDKSPTGDQWVAQVKWDGVRILIYFDGQNVRLFNRKLRERTMQFPEFVDVKRYCTATSVILDGEVIALVDGKPSFPSVMKRDGIRRLDRVDQARRLTPVTYLIFDLLFVNGEWVTGRPLHERQKLLSSVIIPHKDVQLVENFNDAESLFNAIKFQGMEGIVCKDLSSAYSINGKDRRWQKIKNYRDVIAVVAGFTLDGAGIVNSVLLGLYDEKDQLWYIGHSGTGKLTRADWKELTERLKPLVVDERPFINKPDRLKGAIWIKPTITAKIKFAEWTKDKALRQPSIQAFVDIPPDECVFEQ